MSDEATETGTIAVPLPPLGSPINLEALQDRVNRTYGAFGERATGEASGNTRVFLRDPGVKRTLAIIGGVLVASVMLAFMSHPTLDGPRGWASSFRLDTAFAAVWGPLLVWTIWKQKLSKSVHTYLVLALFIEAFSETMFVAKGEGGYWDSVLWPANVAWYGTLKEFAGVPGASLPVFFFVTIGLLARAVWGHDRIAKPPKLAKRALLVFLGAVVGLAVLGMARGGQIDWTFRQTIHMVQLPLVALVFLYTLRIPEDLPAIGTAYVMVAVARALLVAFVYFAICVPKGITELPGKPEWCTNHSDTVLFVSALVVLLVSARQQKSLALTLGAASVLFLAIVLNNRRLAFVSLAVAPLSIYLALDPSRRKRRVTMAFAVLVPLLSAYVLVGSEVNSKSPLLKPAKAIVSVLDQKDTSSQSRDIENENLIYTLRQNPIPKGFGHEYEFSPANPPVDLTDVFRNYRLIAHNGVLWLWSVAGVVGFTFLWFLYPFAGTLAVRGYRTALSPVERSGALAAFGAIIVCVVQIWGDQGMNSYLTLVTFGLAFAVAARLACVDRASSEVGYSPPA